MTRTLPRAILGFCFGLLAGCGQEPPLRATAPPADKGTEQSSSTEINSAGAATETAASFSNFEIIDLTHAFDENTVYWPTASGFRLTVESFGVTDKGYFYAANSFATAEHGGTHTDAPIHFFKDRQTVDAIPLERLMGEGVVVDVRDQCAQNRDYQVTVSDLHDWEERHQRQLVDMIVLLRTGFGSFWPDRQRYMGTDERGAEALAKLHFPGLHPGAAQWLAENRAIKAIGIDTPSIDFGQSSLFQSHVRLFERNIPVFENMAGLDKLPERGFQVVALPTKIAGGSGAPTRIVALVPQETN